MAPEEAEEPETGEAIAQDLMEKLGVLPHQLIEETYIDLLARAAHESAGRKRRV